MDNYEFADGYFLAKKGVTKVWQPEWEADKYMLGDKMFAYKGVLDKLGRPIITLKLPPEESEMLREQYNDIIPGYYMNKVHWSTLFLDSTEVPAGLVKHIIDIAYEKMLAALPKKVREDILR